LSSSTTKTVFVERFDRPTVPGYVSPHAYLRPEGVELMGRDAQLAVIPYGDVRAVYFVRNIDVELDAKERRVFGSRPKLDGLWVRMKLRDNEMLEGAMPNNLLMVGEYGLTVTPPDANSNVQRIFVPRAALEELTVVGVIGSPMRRPRKKRVLPAGQQAGLFGEADSE
jgi:hypothetical protein